MNLAVDFIVEQTESVSIRVYTTKTYKLTGRVDTNVDGTGTPPEFVVAVGGGCFRRIARTCKSAVNLERQIGQLLAW